MQRLTMVRYTVKPEAVAENEALSRKVFDRLRVNQPEGIFYGLFKEEDGVSFVHIFANLVEDDSSAVTGLAEFDAFSAGQESRWTGAPDVTRMSVTAIDTYGIEPGGE